MEFKQENIGKLIAIKPYRTDLQLFSVIIGYNPITERYISYSLDSSGMWDKYSSVSLDAEMYTVEYATQALTEQISELSAQREKLLEIVNIIDDMIKNTNRDNYKNELRKLWQSYSECSRQLSYFIKENNIFHRNMYGIEIREVQKAIRRLNKRFKFFFGDKAEILQDAIRSAGPYGSVRMRLNVVESNIEKLAHCDRYIRRASLKLSGNAV